ncbi:hypothetical protein ACLKA6_001238 [Drosophila palustris]
MNNVAEGRGKRECNDAHGLVMVVSVSSIVGCRLLHATITNNTLRSGLVYVQVSFASIFISISVPLPRSCSY